MVIKEWGGIGSSREGEADAAWVNRPCSQAHLFHLSIPRSPLLAPQPHLPPQEFTLKMIAGMESTVFMLLFMYVIISTPYKCLFCTQSCARHSAWTILFHPHSSSQLDSYAHFTDEDMVAWRVKVTHSWWWYWNSIWGCPTSNIQLFPHSFTPFYTFIFNSCTCASYCT